MPTPTPEETASTTRLSAALERLRAEADKCRRVAREALGIDLDDFRREQLLSVIGEVITSERLKALEHAQADRQEDDLVNSVVKAIHDHFDPLGLRKMRRRRGRKVAHEDRDRRMLAFRRRGLTFGKIAQHFRAKGLMDSSNKANDAQTVRAAIRRAEDRERREREAAEHFEEACQLIESGLAKVSANSKTE